MCSLRAVTLANRWKGYVVVLILTGYAKADLGKKLQEAVKLQQRFDWSLRYVREKFFMKEFFNISKSIQACIMGQKKLNPEMSKVEAEKICVEYVKEQVGK